MTAHVEIFENSEKNIPNTTTRITKASIKGQDLPKTEIYVVKKEVQPLLFMMLFGQSNCSK